MFFSSIPHFSVLDLKMLIWKPLHKSSSRLFYTLRFSRASGTGEFTQNLLPLLLYHQALSLLSIPPPRLSSQKNSEPSPKTPGMFSVASLIAFLQWEKASFPPYTMHPCVTPTSSLRRTSTRQTPRHRLPAMGAHTASLPTCQT